MNILYVCDALAIYGGMERVMVEKANWLVVHGFEVSILTANQGNHPLCFPLHYDVKYEDLNIRFYQQYQLPFWKRHVKNRQLHHLFRKRLASKIQSITPDIIVCTCLDYLRDIIRIKGFISLVFESHSTRLASHFEGDSLLRRLHVWYLQLAVKNVEMVVALTDGDAEEWKKLTPKVCVIPNVVNLNERGSYSDCTARSVIFVGRFSKQKDVGRLLYIWPHVHKRHPDWFLHIYGGYGEERDVILDKIKQVDTNIMVHEPTPDIMEKYKENSILLLTSQYEPFGLVLPEAMSCGLPVVAFDCPYGPADIIDEGINGYLIQERNCDDFAQKICLLMDHEDLRVKMGKAGIESSRRYDVYRIMPLWKKLFKQVVQYN